VSAQTALFSPVTIGELELRNRVVMAPMTRNFSPGGIPTDEVASYYARRAEHDVGCIISEGIAIAHPTAHGYRDVPVLDPDVPLDGWKRVIDGVHAHGSKILAQLWHVGSIRKPGRPPVPSAPSLGPSAVAHPAYGDKGPIPSEMTDHSLDAIRDAYARSAMLAREAGFDGVEIHGAHGYLLDQFIWPKTNLRNDRFGIAHRSGTTFPAEVVRAIRAATTPTFPIAYRFSQWKLGAYEEVVFHDERELAGFLEPMVEAGVDLFHPSTRKWLSSAFPGGTETLAAATRRLSGKPVIAVGSIGVDVDITATAVGAKTKIASFENAIEALERGEFDLLAVGRALLAEPRWASLVREGRLHEATPYEKSLEEKLR